MTGSTPQSMPSDASRLKRQLLRAERRGKAASLALMAPLLVFLISLFFVPLSGMLWKSVDNRVIPSNLPALSAAISDWQTNQPPSESLYTALSHDLKEAYRKNTAGLIGKRLNEEQPGMAALIRKTAFALQDVNQGPWKAVFSSIDERWSTPEPFNLLKREAHPVTLDYYLAAFDRHYDERGNITKKQHTIYTDLFVRTIAMSFIIMLLTTILGFLLAYWIVGLPKKKANLLLIAVLVPFWTSLLVRTTAWLVLLQPRGVINDFLVHMGILENNHRLALVYNELGTVIVMTQILLPFIVLPLYSVMRGIPGDYMRAAISLGASRTRAFWKVYFPHTIPGIGAGSLLVFVLSIGYYITPELVGGRTGQFISNMVAYNVNETLNWGLAAALGTVLTIVTLLIYATFGRFIDMKRLGGK